MPPMFRALESRHPSETGIFQNDLGAVFYYHKECLHREDGPAVEWPNGSFWYSIFGVEHRDDGPSYYDASTGVTQWHREGLLHREDGPAVLDFWEDEGYYIYGNEFSRTQWILEVLASEIVRDKSDYEYHAVVALADTWEGTPKELLEAVRNLS